MAIETSEYVNVTISESDTRVTASMNGERGHISVGGHERDGYIFVRGADGRERVRLDGRSGSAYIGGNGSDGDLYIRRTVTEHGRSVDRVVMRFKANRGNIRVGGSGADGDILLFPEGVTDIAEDSAATIWLDSGRGNIAAGGNGSDGDILLFPESARISTTDGTGATIWLDSHHANIAAGGNGSDGDIMLFPRTAAMTTSDVSDTSLHLDGNTGNINLQGGLMPKGRPFDDEFLGGYSTNEGAVRHFQGSHRYGSIEFTHSHPPSRGDREKLRNILIFNPLIHNNSIVFITPHTATPCTHSIGTMPHSPDPPAPGEGYYINLHMSQKQEPGTRVRIVYWIMN